MTVIWQKIKEWFQILKQALSKANCYKAREAEGYAIFGMCGGLMGGDYSTEYLQYSCCGCKYYTEVDTYLMKRGK